MSTGQPLRVLYILGSGRCGSTLLDRALGAQQQFVGVGELARIWKTGMARNAMCSCGLPFAECHFWSPVCRQAFGSWDAAEGLRLHQIRKSVVRFRNIPRMLRWYQKGLHGDASAIELASKTQALYEAIRDRSGAQIIVDSSKNSVLPFFLRTIEGLDVTVVHLVRDSRAVAYSWKRRRQRLGAREALAASHQPADDSNPAESLWMPQYSLNKSSWQWLWVNYVGSLLGRLKGIRYLRIRYEDMVADLDGTLAQIADSIEYPETMSADWRAAASNCIFSGNPLRFHQGAVQLKADMEWQSQMSLRARSLVTLLTLPGLIKFGYLSRSAYPSDADPRTLGEPRLTGAAEEQKKQVHESS